MEHGSIEREIHVAASPEVVFEVVSRPEHIAEWWPDEVDLDPTPGGRGELRWRGDDGTTTSVPMTVVESDPPRTFSFWWAYEADEEPARNTAFLVTFELVPDGDGTRVLMTETGFREQGWEVARFEAAYQEHAQAWDHFLPRLAAHARSVGAAS